MTGTGQGSPKIAELYRNCYHFIKCGENLEVFTVIVYMEYKGKKEKIQKERSNMTATNGPSTGTQHNSQSGHSSTDL
jgi:hypothetical protein